MEHTLRGVLLSVLAAIVLVGAAAAQKPAPPSAAPVPERSSRLKANEYRIVVKGCIRGRRVSASDVEGSDSVFRTLRATEFLLQGPRELLQQIKEHDGHYDEVDGIATVPASTNQGSSTVTTKDFGKTHVTVGGREEGKAYVQEPPKPLTLKVTSLTHLQEGCAGH